MNINLNNIAVGPGTIGAGVVDAERATAEASQFTRATPGLEITAASVALGAPEPVADVPASALVRNDALGSLVNSAFSFPPPPMPAFGD